MYKVAVEDSTMIWHCHANTLRVRYVILHFINNNCSTSTINTAELLAPQALCYVVPRPRN